MSYGNTEVFMTLQERDALIQSYIGKKVDVIIDRPVGHVHVTKGVTLHYTINYGYIPGVIGGDGEEQDVYVLGVTEPLERFTGTVIGAIRRRDDNEDKLVVSPEDMVFHQGQIEEATYFVEKYFDSTITCLLRKSCGVIPYRRTHRGTELLLLLQSSGWWSFPKGHMDRGESEQETALRETREETGLEAQLLPGFREVTEYSIGPNTRKQLVLFLGEVSGEITLAEREIKAYRWMSIQEAKTFLLAEQHPILDRAEARLKEEEK